MFLAQYICKIKVHSRRHYLPREYIPEFLAPTGALGVRMLELRSFNYESWMELFHDYKI